MIPARPRDGAGPNRKPRASGDDPVGLSLRLPSVR